MKRMLPLSLALAVFAVGLAIGAGGSQLTSKMAAVLVSAPTRTPTPQPTMTLTATPLPTGTPTSTPNSGATATVLARLQFDATVKASSTQLARSQREAVRRFANEMTSIDLELGQLNRDRGAWNQCCAGSVSSQSNRDKTIEFQYRMRVIKEKAGKLTRPSDASKAHELFLTEYSRIYESMENFLAYLDTGDGSKLAIANRLIDESNLLRLQAQEALSDLAVANELSPADFSDLR